jgi:hypothetical protein
MSGIQAADKCFDPAPEHLTLFSTGQKTDSRKHVVSSIQPNFLSVIVCFQVVRSGFSASFRRTQKYPTVSPANLNHSTLSSPDNKSLKNSNQNRAKTFIISHYLPELKAFK